MHTDSRVRGGAADIDKYLREIAQAGQWPVEEALPTTRALGKKFTVANTTASRVYQRLETEGLVWKQANGRYFLASSRQLLHRPKPLACLTRELARWSAVYRAIMEGVSAYTTERQTALLLWRSEALVTHQEAFLPPVFGSLQQQGASLLDFERCYGDVHGGVLIDDLWSDEALLSRPNLLAHAVVLYRESKLSGVGNVCIDVESAGLLALSHLLARSYDELWIARPFRNDPATDTLIASVMEVAQKAGTGSLSYQIKEASTPADRAALVREAAEAECRIGVFCPEDNVTQFLYEEMIAQEVPCPGRIGLLSGMGTDVLDDAISTLSYDFRAMGALAAEMLYSGKSEQIKIRPDLRANSST